MTGTCWKQAVFALAWFRDRPDIPRLGKGFGISQATAYRYLDEAIEVLAARAPGLREALEKAKEQGLPYLILDGKVVAADRCKEKTISRKGRGIDRWYSGKAHGFGGNIQALPVRAGFRPDVPAVAHPAARHAQPRQDRRHRPGCLVLVQFEHKMITLPAAYASRRARISAPRTMAMAA